jgi:hypothetical protein
LLSPDALCVGVAARVGGVVLTGVVGAVVVRVGLGAVTVLVAVAEGAVTTGAVLLGDADGLWPRVDCPGVGVAPPPSGDGESLPSVVGPAVPSAWVRSPLLSYVIPPGTPEIADSSPEEAATAPTAIAADEASSPVRTGWCRRRPRWPVRPF